MVRSRFDAQLEQLNVELIKMGALCEEAITASVSALMKYDRTVVQMVFEKDNEIDHMERDIETFCMRLLLQQQPVARDLRQISTALKVVTDLERIGDHASDIAELILRIKSDHAYHIVQHLPAMAASAQKMLHAAVEAFIKQDVEEAEEIIRWDDEVDALFNQANARRTGYAEQAAYSGSGTRNGKDGNGCSGILCEKGLDTGAFCYAV